MRVPPYRERTRAELRRAMRWAQRALHLQGWTLRLLFDERATASYGRCPGGAASVWHNYATRDAVIHVWMDVAALPGRDRLSCLFHEMGHLATWPLLAAENQGMDILSEQAADTVADLLCRLWVAEGRDGPLTSDL